VKRLAVLALLLAAGLLLVPTLLVGAAVLLGGALLTLVVTWLLAVPCTALVGATMMLDPSWLPTRLAWLARLYHHVDQLRRAEELGRQERHRREAVARVPASRASVAASWPAGPAC
jgi:hypothetical protein